ncbi:MAG TPA: hypothetical protein VMO78_04585 [Rhizomicrobium sp.]|nr:hypothetical protein [Rhizomicrobium sp.]
MSDIVREIAALKSRLTLLDRERSEIAERLGAGEAPKRAEGWPNVGAKARLGDIATA